jgi:hypothetical protein
MSRQRVLLVEFAALGRFVLAIEFPFVHAWLKRLGVATRWLRFALDPAVQFERGESGIGLDETDLATLADHLRRERATHVLLSAPPAAALLERIRGAAPAADVRRVGRHDEAESCRADPADGAAAPRGLALEPGALSDWLGLDPPAGATTVVESDGLRPDFGFLAANEAARRMDPLGFMVTGAECLYRRSLVDAPAYAGVDLAGCRTTGCAFCTTGGTGPTRSGPVAGRVIEQIDAFLETYPFAGAEWRPRLRLPGHQAFREAADLAAALRGRTLRGLDLLLDARTDHILAREVDLARAAQLLEGTGHRVHVCLVGVESFARAELERMNKGVEPWQNLAAIRVLRTLERRHPRSFGFREHGGLSTILYTPWTTLYDLGLNLAVARHFRLSPYLGKLLHSRLRLYDRLPMTALARRDGLLRDTYDDPALDTARRNFYPDEIPWRFLDPRVEVVNRVTTRMNPDPALAADPLYAKVQAWCGRGERIALAADLVACALAAPGVPDAEALLAAVTVGSTPAPAPAAASASRAPTGPTERPAAVAPVREGDGFVEVEPLVALQRAGLNRANRLEGLARGPAAALGERLRGESLAARLVERVAPEGATFDLFFGPSADDVTEAVGLTEVQYRGGPVDELTRARRRLGELYGYPPCCCEAFAGVQCARPAVNEWLILERRCRQPGPISPLLSPFGDVAMQYVPCSFQCAASLARAARVGEVFAARFGAAERDRLQEQASLPTLFLLDHPGAALRLVPRGAVGRDFEFTAGSCRSADPRLRAVAEGGRLRVGEGTVVVERAGRLVASFFLSAALFWHGAAFDADFWREVAREALEPAEPDEPAFVDACAPSGPTTAAPRRHVPAFAERLLVRLTRLLLASAAPALGAYRVEAVHPTAGRAVTVVLRPRDPAAGGEIELAVEPLRGAGRFYVAAGYLAITHAPRTPLATAAQRDAVDALAALLARGFDRPGAG